MTKAIVGQVSKLETSERSINFLTPPLVLKLLTLPAILAALAVLAHLSSYLGCAGLAGLAGHASRAGHCSISCVPLKRNVEVISLRT